MTSLAENTDTRVADVRFDDDSIIVDLYDGRSISAPLIWFPRLANATPENRMNWKVSGGGFGLHWPGLDEDISTEGLLRGARSPEARLQSTAPT